MQCGVEICKYITTYKYKYIYIYNIYIFIYLFNIHKYIYIALSKRVVQGNITTMFLIPL